MEGECFREMLIIPCSSDVFSVNRSVSWDSEQEPCSIYVTNEGFHLPLYFLIVGF